MASHPKRELRDNTVVCRLWMPEYSAVGQFMMNARKDARQWACEIMCERWCEDTRREAMLVVGAFERWATACATEERVASRPSERGI